MRVRTDRPTSHRQETCNHRVGICAGSGGGDVHLGSNVCVTISHRVCKSLGVLLVGNTMVSRGVGLEGADLG